MNRLTAFFHWLGTPLRAVNGWFPFTHEGRQTLVYLVFAGAGPTLTLTAIWIMREALAHGLGNVFGNVAYVIAWSLLIIVTGLAMFVSIRAVKLGKDGFEAGGWRGPDDDAPTPIVTTTTTTAVSPEGKSQ